MKKILILNGPNMNMLGLREPEIYGRTTYAELEDKIKGWAEELGCEVTLYQSNHEGDLVDRIQAAYKKFDGIVINPAGYTHTSIAIPDAIKAVSIPTVEVHISDIEKREDYRKVSYTKDACIATVMGKGIEGYREALAIILT